ncbi:ATP synthase subunit alpha, mitochondrial [Elsinoe australis]|uniref:ATP synthase subunit alpha, mitochondrial n=1 Tax=Elsinoe australis TaxID=40998 RepID=A0A2P7YIR7_9PEZI|nr:ATP synthase subunit alpha, mitochondrial [Elsinoe australis]
MKVLIDVDLREAQPPCVTITPYQLPQEDMPFFIGVRRQLQSAGWYAYFDDAMERLSGLISKAIERRGGYGVTTDELQLIVDFGKDLAHVMVSFLALGERLTNQAERRRGRTIAPQVGQPLASESVTKTQEATTNITCKQQTISFFDLPPEIRARVYAHLPAKQSLTECRYDYHKLASLHKFQPPPLLQLPEILRLEGSHTFDHLRMCIYLFSIDDRRKQSWNDQTLPSWSLEELLSKKTAAWLRDSGPGWTIEFNHLRVCGPEKVRYDIDVIDNGREVRIRDRRTITDQLAAIDYAHKWYRQGPQRERTKLELLAERLERSIRDRQGAGISAVEIGVLIDGMLGVMLARRCTERGDKDEIMG